MRDDDDDDEQIGSDVVIIYKRREDTRLCAAGVSKRLGMADGRVCFTAEKRLVRKIDRRRFLITPSRIFGVIDNQTDDRAVG